ncbi:MAG: selenocysteine-specific translation elongation factor [Gemmatimonadaceae bacterium]
MILGTAGHIDHGKTALVRALTGIDTDRLPEEKRRGITIELGFAPLILPGGLTIGVVDVPGHEAFVRTMLAGATGIDLALLVIAADEGVMPQTREHLAILRLLGIRSGLVALTKSDLVDADWLELVKDDARELVKGTGLESGPIVPTSTVTDAGIDELRSQIGAIAQTLPARERNDLFRMPVDRSFSPKGAGTVVTGTIWSGTVRPDATLTLLPGGRQVRVRTVQSHGQASGEAGPGTRTALGLAGIDAEEVPRGTMLVSLPEWRASTTLRARVAVLDTASRGVRPREWVRLHLGTAEVGARVVASGGPLESGEIRAARLLLDEPLAARAGDRFVLRRGSPPETIGGGQVIDPAPFHRRARPWDGMDIGGSGHLDAILREADTTGEAISQLPVRLGVTKEDVTQLLKSCDSARSIGSRVFHAAVIEQLRAVLLDHVAQYHRDHPLTFGLASADWRGRVHGHTELIATIERELLEAGEIEQSAGLVRLPGWRPVLDDHQKQLRERLLGQMVAAGLEAPSVTELEKEHGASVVSLLRILSDDGLVVQIETDRYMSTAALDSARETLRRAMRGAGPTGVEGAGSGAVVRREFTASELRDILGVSRKFLIPLLERFDREGVTERRKEGRVLHDG